MSRLFSFLEKTLRKVFGQNIFFYTFHNIFELVHVYLQTHITCTDMKCSIYIEFYTQKRKLSEQLRMSLDCNDGNVRKILKTFVGLLYKKLVFASITGWKKLTCIVFLL